VNRGEPKVDAGEHALADPNAAGIARAAEVAASVSAELDARERAS
jgi:hypothetical protein